MKEAYNHSRVSPAGMAAGKQMAEIADAECIRLAAIEEPDTRCKTCAFRAGTVPNGCAQTQLDALKAVCEDVPFMCHQVKGAICHGWFAVRVVALRKELESGQPMPACPWDFSPPDEAPILQAGKAATP